MVSRIYLFRRSDEPQVMAISLPCEPPSSAAETGAVGEDCLSARALCEREFRSRQFSRAAQGSPKGRRTGAAFSLVTFFWPRKRKSPAAGLLPAKLMFRATQLFGATQIAPYELHLPAMNK